MLISTISRRAKIERQFEISENEPNSNFKYRKINV